jgi:hypothetical protein
VHRWLAAFVVFSTFLVVSCSSSGSGTADPSAATPSDHAKMICADEAQEDLAATLGVKPTQVSTPTWSQRLYSCNYEYSDGVISLRLKELPDAAATTDYFEGLAKDRGQTTGGISLGEGAFATPTELVLRKDFMVLDIDVSHLPAQFGQPARSPSDVKLAVAQTLLGCWQ